jgi:uncharacterized membrane protein
MMLLALAMLAYALIFSYLTLNRFFAFEARALDMGNLDQAVWNTAHGRFFHLTNQPGTVNRLSLHVEPILIPISWLYWLYSGPPTLLVLQATVVALGAWPLFAIAHRRLGSQWMALLFGLVFLLNPTIQAANWLEFHPLTLAPTFLLATFACLLARRTGWFACFAIFAASCKEEIALLVAMIGLYAFLFLRQRRLGLLTILLGIGWALVAVLVIQTTFAAGNIHWDRYAYLGDNPAQMVHTVFTNPQIVLAQLRQVDALRYLALLLLPVGFIALLAPEILVLALPSLAINLLSTYPAMQEVYSLMYAAPIVPFVLIAASFGVRRLAIFATRNWQLTTGNWQLATRNWQLATRNWQLATRNWQLATRNSYFTYLTCALLIASCTLYTFHQFGYLPGGGNFQYYQVTDHHRRAADLIAQIPPDAKVSAQDRLNPHVSSRETVYIFPNLGDADTIFLDVTGPAWPLHPNDLRNQVADLLAADFGIAAAEDGYLLLRKGAEPKRPPDAFYSVWLEAPLPERQPAFVFADRLTLLDHRLVIDSHGELVTQLVWEALKPIDQNLRFYVGYLDREGNVMHDTEFYPPVAELWYPTTQWPPGKPVLVQSLPWTLDADYFTLVLALFANGDPHRQANRLPVSVQSEQLVTLEGDTLARLGGYTRNEAGDWRRLNLPPPLPPAQAATEFGGQVRLDGWRLGGETVSPGAAAPLVFSWHAIQRPLMDYSLFVHLIDENGNKVAQVDWQPRDRFGPRPLTTWRTGQSIVDEQVLPLPPDLPPGRYQLILGLYDWQTGERLPVAGANARPDQTAQIAEIDLKLDSQ